MNQTLTEIDTIAVEAKLASGLVYVPGLETGITRKLGARGFMYYRPCPTSAPMRQKWLN